MGVLSAGTPTEADCYVEEVDEAFPALAVGRYEIIELVGVGGMGRVFRARDPSLERDIAVKTLRVVSDETQARMLREARTMAALSHPNVVPIYDVGIDGDELFIAMEFVRGDNLRGWLKHGPRPWRDVVRVLAAAGRGLHAAHQAGVVHRDFKPANVVLGDDGRARVMDFGLARSIPTPPSITVAGDPPRRDPGPKISRTGVIVGTPVYIAPELETGATATAAADQYSFCITLYEALYGERPFLAESREALSRLKWKGKVLPPPRDSDVPRRLFDICVRGLSVEPGRRFGSMQELVEQLDRAPHPSRRRWVAGAGLAVLGLAAAGVAWTTRAANECAGAERAVAEVWNPERRAAVGERAAELLDAHFEAWEQARTELCRAEPSRAVDVQRVCLDQTLRQSAAIVTVAVDADGDDSDAARNLPEIGACTDPERRNGLDPPAELAAQVWSARAVLARVTALSRLGRFDEARELLSAEISTELTFAPLQAEIALTRGELADRAGVYDEAAPVLREAYFLAVQAEHHDVAFEAARMVTSVEGLRRGDLEAASEWFGHARSHLEHVREPAVDEAVLLYSHAGNVYNAGRHAEAKAMIERSVELLDTLQTPRQHLRIDALLARGSIYGWDGQDATARADFDEALRLSETEYGPEHPKLARALMNSAIALRIAGEYEAAAKLHERGVAMTVSTLGVDHPKVPRALNGLAQVLSELGRDDEAYEKANQALAIAQKVHGEQHQEVARVLRTLTRMRAVRGDTDGAVAAAQRVLAIQDAVGRRNDLYASDLSTLASILLDVGRLDEAEAAVDEAIEMMETGMEPGHPFVGRAYAERASVFEARGKPAEARLWFDKAVDILARVGDGETHMLAGVLDRYARMLAAAGEGQEARPLLERALAIYDKTKAYPETTADARELLASLR